MQNKIRIFFITLLIFISLLINLRAEIVNEIIIEGNNRTSKETIRVYGEIDENKDLSAADVNNVLKNLYSTDFFEDIKINLTNNTLRIVVKEYPLINSLDLKGESSNAIKNKVLEKLFLKEKGSFIENQLSQDIKKIVWQNVACF